jgi:hypothetical protein
MGFLASAVLPADAYLVSGPLLSIRSYRTLIDSIYLSTATAVS